MDAFERARLKHAKNAERNARYEAKKSEEIPEKKAEPKVAARPAPKPMVIKVSGPADLTFEVHYQGSLLSSQQSPEELTKLFKKQLAVFGRVL